MKKFLCCFLSIIGSGILIAEEIPDSRVRTFVTPARVVWTSLSNDQCSVQTPEILLRQRYGQVPEGRFLSGSGCRLENKGKPASIIVDFGKELHGGLLIGSGNNSVRTVKIRVRFGESVAESMAELGERGACNDHAVRDSVIELSKYGTREIGNTGFRFVRIDLMSRGVFSLEFLRAISLMRPMKYRGSFRCNDERLNQVWSTAARTVHLCCQDFLWDGIKRDRLVWMGDSHPEMMSILAVFGAAEILPDSLDYMKKITLPDEWMNGMPSYTLWWIRCVHDWYQYTGDLAYLQKHHVYLGKTIQNVLKYIGPENQCTMNGFLDWPTQHNQKAVAAGMQALMVTAFEGAAEMSKAFKNAALEKQCQDAAARLRRYRPGPEGSKQAAAMLALAGLQSPQKMYEEILGEDGVQGVSTFYGYYMLEAMSAAGENQRALDTIRDYWGAMLDMGATSFWEDFDVSWTNNAFRIDELPVKGKKDIHGDYGQFCYKGFRHSLCHGWSSGPSAWLIHHVLGIQPLDVGCHTVRVAPFLGDLQWAEGSFPLPEGGEVHVRAERQKDGSCKINVHAPDHIKIIRGK